MKWWSDCTTNWREKWRKVRDERNKTREESRILFNKLETINKQLFIIESEKCDLQNEVKKLRQEIKELTIFCSTNHSNKSFDSKKQLENDLCHKFVSNTI
jgi:predicted nuclease with TOPRIM domain